MSAVVDTPFPNPISRAVFYNKYSRFDHDLKRRETKPEALGRADKFLQERFTFKGGVWQPGESELITRSIHRLEALCSMRLLWSAGPALARNHIMAYNCAFMTVNRLRAFAEALYVLMSGTGVGYSVEGEYVSQLPRIKKQKPGLTPDVFVIPDTTEGWADALDAGIESWWNGRDITFDSSQVRPAGEILKIKGGRSSGPGPLLNSLSTIRQIILKGAGRNAHPIMVHDIMCLIAEVVVVGGIRRASLISLFDVDDVEMRNAKGGQFWNATPWRAMSNNSIAYNDEPSDEALLDIWSTMIRGKGGEPGIFNREAFRVGAARRKRWPDTGCNPCVTGDTVLATLNGPKTFAELAESGKPVAVYSWDPATKIPVIREMVAPRKTGENVEIIEVEFDSGLKVRLTPTHSLYTFRGEKVQAQDLKINQSVRAFSMSEHRDGHLRVHGWNSTDNCANHQWVARMVWECYNGPVPEGYVVHHLNEDKTDNRIENLVAITALQHNQEHYLERLENGFHHPLASKQQYLDTYAVKNHKVVAIKAAGRADVYNGTVDDSHTYIILDPVPVAGIASGIVSANCGEINLRDQEFCNLSEIICRPDDTRESLVEKVRAATIIGTIQATLTDFPYLNPKWKANCDDEALLGVSATGHMGCPAFRDADVLRELKRTAIEVNKDFAERLGINQSAAITTGQPSGTKSLFAWCSSGAHTWWSKFGIRRIRLNTNDVMLTLYRMMGYTINPDPMTPGTFVIDFPFAAPEGAVTRHDLNALQQLEHWLLVKENYVEHNQSMTIYVKDTEWIGVVAWVKAHWAKIGGLSFLPSDDHMYPLAPYEEVTEERYNEMLGSLPVFTDEEFALNLQALESEDNTSGASELACEGAKCDLPR